jgi:hypothetical protein
VEGQVYNGQKTDNVAGYSAVHISNSSGLSNRGCVGLNRGHTFSIGCQTRLLYSPEELPALEVIGIYQ